MANDEEVVTGNVTFLQLAVNLSPAESLVAISFSKLLGFQKKKGINSEFQMYSQRSILKILFKKNNPQKMALLLNVFA